MKDNLPLVSVIVPVFNAEEYLCQCVESVLAQSYTRWELLLIDDGSTDGSAKICNKFAARDVRVKVSRQKNKGVSAARNKGLDISRGEFVMFLDADDFLHYRAIEMLMSVVINREMDVVMAEFKEFSKVSRNIYYMYTDSFKTRFRYYSVSPEIAVRKILYQRILVPSPCAKLFRRNLFRTLRFREGIRYEDLDIIPKIIYAAKNVCWIPKFIYFYRQHPGSFLHRVSLGRADVLDVTAGLTEYFKDKAPMLEKAALDRELSANFNILTLFTRHLEEFPENERGEAEGICRRAWARIKELRLGRLTDRRVRLKNKAAILASYLGGQPLLRSLSRFLK